MVLETLPAKYSPSHINGSQTRPAKKLRQLWKRKSRQSLLSPPDKLGMADELRLQPASINLEIISRSPKRLGNGCSACKRSTSSNCRTANRRANPGRST